MLAQAPEAATQPAAEWTEWIWQKSSSPSQPRHQRERLNVEQTNKERKKGKQAMVDSILCSGWHRAMGQLGFLGEGALQRFNCKSNRSIHSS